ncbi:MAG: hypothetical protein O3A39_04095 [Proteobacteria bacterium]|nr:hypothetical protein [Pseudomonadota bacterium]
MGMFDYVEIECELPIPSYVPDSIISLIKRSFEENSFQTKDFECELATYRVTNDGKLYRSLLSWFEDKVIEPEKLVDYHGIFEVSTLVYLDDSNLLDTGEYLGVGSNGYKSRILGPNMQKNWIWVCYKLKFTDGFLVDLFMISPTQEDLNLLSIK